MNELTQENKRPLLRGASLDKKTNPPAQRLAGGGADGTRTRGLRRDRPAL